MARHTLDLPIIKSSNDFGYKMHVDFYYDPNIGFQGVEVSPQAVDNTLTTIYRPNAKARFGVAWDGQLIPKGKEIYKATLHFFTTSSHGKTIYYRYADFAEGSTIPTHEPADGAKAGGASYGWGEIDIGKPIGSSLILYAELGPKKINVWVEGTIMEVEVAEMWRLFSHRNPTNQPYVRIEYGDIPPNPPTSLYPNGTTEDPRNTIKFSWTHSSDANVPQKSFRLQYSLDGWATWENISWDDPQQSFELPAVVLPETGTVVWRIQTTDTNDETSEYSHGSFKLGAPPQRAPIPITPISQYVDETEPISFEWIFNGGSIRDIQAKVELQYSVDSGTSWTSIIENTLNTAIVLEAGTFAKGNVLWQVRTYNQFDDASPYSEMKSFSVIGVPSIPLITEITNRARPTIVWQTQEQKVFDLEIIKDETIYKTGAVPDASVREFLLPVYIENGDYIVRIRIANEYGLYSAWAEKRFSVDVEKPEKPSITIYNGDFGVTLKTDSILRSLVYRDGEIIGEMKNGMFVDCTGSGDYEYRYYIRAVDENDSFSDSDLKLGRCRLPVNTIALLEDPDEYTKLQHDLDGPPQKANTFTVNATLQYYDGREYPIAEFSEFKTAEKSMTFFFTEKSEVERFKSLISKKRVLIYRDTDGEVIIGNVFTLGCQRSVHGYNVSFTIVRTV